MYKKEEEYKKLDREAKQDMFWPKGTLVKRRNVTGSDRDYFTEGKLYELLDDKLSGSISLHVIEDHGKKGGTRESTYFDLVALPEDLEPKIKDTYDIY